MFLPHQYARCPLHCTCEEGTPEAALVLLERGAEVSLKDKVRKYACLSL